MWVTLWLGWGCTGQGLGGDSRSDIVGSAPPDSNTETGETDVRSWHGESPGGGLGASVVALDDLAWAGAPWGETGAVWELSTGQCSVFPEVMQATLGFALALSHDGHLAAGAPLGDLGAGHIAVSTGTTLTGTGGDLRGGALAWGEELWSVGGSTLWHPTDPITLPERAGALGLLDGRPLIGLPRGPDALWFDGVTWPRLEDQDEAGFALCVSDLDGDGIDDVVVGAPGSGRVHLLFGSTDSWDLSERVLTGPGGRFGHSLACAEETLLVGAPLAAEGRGAVWLLEGSPETWQVDEATAEGRQAGEHFGAALALEAGAMWIGAPIADEGAGRVDQLMR